jgi:hypothetical protein
MDFILSKLRDPARFSARAMFGEYALYADGKVVALVCDDRLYVKIVPASQPLESLCEQGQPYPGARLHYLVDEGQISSLDTLPAILGAMADSLPARRSRAPRKRRA